jgi:hypothetical protein
MRSYDVILNNLICVVFYFLHFTIKFLTKPSYLINLLKSGFASGLYIKNLLYLIKFFIKLNNIFLFKVLNGLKMYFKINSIKKVGI